VTRWEPIAAICVVAAITAGCRDRSPTSPSPTARAPETITLTGTLTDRVHGTGTLRIIGAGRDGIYIGSWVFETAGAAQGGTALINLTMIGERTPAIILQPSTPPCPGSPAASLATFGLVLTGSPMTMSGTSNHITCEGALVEGRVELVRQ
jgi:hypothetical protein